MAIAVKNNYIYSAEWNSVQIFEYGEIDGPDLDLSIYELNYPYVENGQSYTMSLNVINNGNQILNIVDAYVDAHLLSYNINDNLSFYIRPEILDNSSLKSLISMKINF